MSLTPEDCARKNIDRLLMQAGWRLCDRKNAAIDAAEGMNIRQYPMRDGGIADYAMYIGGKCAGVIEAKALGKSLSGGKSQATKYINGLPPNIPAWAHPLPFYYLSTGEETRFYNGLSPTPKTRNVFAFHTPAALQQLLEAGKAGDFAFMALIAVAKPLQFMYKKLNHG